MLLIFEHILEPPDEYQFFDTSAFGLDLEISKFALIKFTLSGICSSQSVSLQQLTDLTESFKLTMKKICQVDPNYLLNENPDFFLLIKKLGRFYVISQIF